MAPKPKHHRHYEICPDMGCWIWMRSKNHGGYGELRHEGKVWAAHRLYWTQRFGDIPDGARIMHKCDNPACVNPDHLEMGSAADNSKQMIEKGRSLRGSKNPNAVLSDEKVSVIRRLISSGVCQSDISVLSGVSRTSINRIVKGKSWKNVK